MINEKFLSGGALTLSAFSLFVSIGLYSTIPETVSTSKKASIAPAIDRLNDTIQSQTEAHASLDSTQLDSRIHAKVAEAMQAAGVDQASLDSRILASLRQLAEKSVAEPGQATENKRPSGDSSTSLVDVRPVDPTIDHIDGNLNAPVSLIVYNDYECPFCRRHQQTLSEIRQAFPDRVNVVIRDFPLGMHGRAAKLEAVVAECVARTAGDEAYYRFVNELFERTRGNGRGLPKGGMQRLLSDIGVDSETVSRCQTNQRDEVIANINADMSEAKSIGVHGTPGNVLIDNETGEARRIDGARPFGQFKATIEKMVGSTGQ